MDPFVAEIRIFPFNFAPRGWAFCDGRLLPLSQNTALFSLLGTTYGGNGQSNFALPNLQGRAAMQPGQGPGLSLRDLGEQGGSESITLLEHELPAHSHPMRAGLNPGDLFAPTPQASLGQSTGGAMYVGGGSAPPLVAMSFEAMPAAGASLPHSNMQPYLALNFCIALQGVYPQRP